MPFFYHKTLRVFPSAGECFAAITELDATFKRVHKRNAKAALVYSLLGHAVKGEPDEHGVAIQVEDESAMVEVAWFQQAIEAL